MKGSNGIIAFLSDFGSDSLYPSLVKGAIHLVWEDARIIDITHSVPPFDIETGAFMLHVASSWYPEGTVFLAVVDPGVGGRRRPIVIETNRFLFVGPDNGLLYMAACDDGIISSFTSFLPPYVFQRETETFHGRDIFAPISAHLARGEILDRMGEKVPNESIVRLDRELPAMDAKGIWVTVVLIDPFGNMVITLTKDDFLDRFPSGVCLVHGEKAHLASTYEDIKNGCLGIIPGSMGMLEISLKRDSAAKRLKLARGERVRFEYS